jgi:hypothetical protein
LAAAATADAVGGRGRFRHSWRFGPLFGVAAPARGRLRWTLTGKRRKRSRCPVGITARARAGTWRHPMASVNWNRTDLTTFENADTMLVRPKRDDGKLIGGVPIWVVVTGGEVFVRSARGPEGLWYRHARSTGEGVVRADGKQFEVRFVPVDGKRMEPAVNEAYQAKYGNSGYVDSMLEDASASTTLRLEPPAAE